MNTDDLCIATLVMAILCFLAALLAELSKALAPKDYNLDEEEHENEDGND